MAEIEVTEVLGIKMLFRCEVKVEVTLIRLSNEASGIKLPDFPGRITIHRKPEKPSPRRQMAHHQIADLIVAIHLDDKLLFTITSSSRQNEDLRRYIQRSEDIPWQGALSLYHTAIGDPAYEQYH